MFRKCFSLCETTGSIVNSLTNALDGKTSTCSVGIHCRQKLVEFYCEILSLADCSHELTTAILEHIFCLWPQETNCVEKLVGIISDIRQPMESIDPTAAHERELNVIKCSSLI